MKAFTHFCRHINISLMNDSITIYTRDTTKDPFSLFSGFTEFYEQQQLIELIQNLRSENLGIKRFVTQHTTDHEQYHQDQFNRKIQHAHLQFAETIDEAKFDSILIVFVAHGALSAEEKERLMATFRQANVLEATGIVYSSEEEKVRTQLFYLEGKAAELEFKSEEEPFKYKTAATTARALYQKLDNELNVYCVNRTHATFEAFKANCHEAITAARPVLEQHRGLKQILGNILLAIGLFGVGYVVAGLVNLYVNDRFLFFKTDSEDKINHVAEHIERLPTPLPV